MFLQKHPQTDESASEKQQPHLLDHLKSVKKLKVLL